MNPSIVFLLFNFLLVLPYCSFGQKWVQSEVKSEDTIIETKIYVDQKGKPLQDTTGTHKVVFKYLDYFLLEWKRYGINNQATEDKRGVHKKEKFWKYYKFYNKNNKQLLTVKDDYKYEHADATYCIYLYNEQGNLIEVSYYRDEVVMDKKENIVVRNRVKAVGAYKGMTHKFVYQHSKNSRIIQEHLFDKNDKFQESRTLKIMKKQKKKKKK